MGHRTIEEIREIVYQAELRLIYRARDLGIDSPSDTEERLALALAHKITISPEEREAFHYDNRRIQAGSPS